MEKQLKHEEMKVLVAMYVEFQKADINMRNIFNRDLLDMERTEMLAAFESLATEGLIEVKMEELIELTKEDGFATKEYVPLDDEFGLAEFKHMFPASLLVTAKGIEFVESVLLGMDSDASGQHEKWVRLLIFTRDFNMYDIYLNVLAYVTSRYATNK